MTSAIPIRFGANHSAEDEQNLTKVNFDVELFDVYAAGYLEGAGGALTRGRAGLPALGR